MQTIFAVKETFESYDYGCPDYEHVWGFAGSLEECLRFIIRAAIGFQELSATIKVENLVIEEIVLGKFDAPDDQRCVRRLVWHDIEPLLG